MKKLLLVLLTTLMMVGCTYTKEGTIKNLSADDYILEEIDSCEYFMVHISSYTGGGCFLPIHKNNCRFCKERDSIKWEKRKKELEELVIQLKEE